ncbi:MULTISPECIES: N-acetylmuramoyl-L-alanine amidase family protein [unclassified Bacillus (in: firmicutes)]|uniref:N-acetylmuramoyl-L-alanine amidase family protein n=1 Tax=unclassified Bacillus (in: firmicutes) TaxID=185979 RepID=UPI0008F34518|nr:MULTISPECIES: N-acetylmuramoyl-L-alanine amidase family protein [unclassified Bacillus (in: firmicutes)]SFB02596.1 Putative cell wall binding repeat-containing protein [Bacillus sp. UNCCL13]SFQ89042.1 Putative cell wall binding repeat-containing protein [Bacillus sp. cl95]
MKDKTEIIQNSTKTSLYEKSNIFFNAETAKIYAIDTTIMPRDIEAFEVVNGVIQNHYDSPFHGEYDLGVSGKVTPDGMHYYNASGDVFELAQYQSGDMQYGFTFGKKYNDFEFSVEHQLTFGASSTSGIDVYQYGTNKYLYPLRKDLNVQKFHYQDGKLVMIHKDSNGHYFLETMSADTQPTSGLPDTPGVPDPAGTIDNLGFKPYDTVMDSSKPIVYMTRLGSKTIYAANFVTGEIKALALPYPAERIELFENKLYVTQHKMVHRDYTDQQLAGAIVEVDAETFTATKLIDVDTDPYDFVIDENGFAYISSGSNHWEKVKVYNLSNRGEIPNPTASDIYKSSNLYYSPELSKVYVTSTEYYPSSVKAIEVDHGVIQNQYESPYQGKDSFQAYAKISPDGLKLYNRSGVVCNLTQSESGDMGFAFILGAKYKDYDFSLQEQLTFAANINGGIDVYKYNTNEYLYSVGRNLKVQNLYSQNGIFAIYEDNAGAIHLVKINMDERYIREDLSKPEEPVSPIELLESVSVTYYDDETYEYDEFFDGVKNVPLSRVFAFNFDQSIRIADDTKISIIGPNGYIETYNEVDDDVLYVSPDLLNEKTTYTLKISKEALVGTDGNKLTEDIVIHFQTASSWEQFDGFWHYYDPAIGDYVTGWKKINAVTYYFNSYGEMQTGWEKVNNVWYYFNTDGSMKTGWLKIGTASYYLGSKGAMQTGWLKVDNKWYFFESSGKMKMGWLKSGTSWYYLNTKGVMQTGWLKLDNKWYFFDSSGKMKTGWLKSGTSWYYLNTNGVMHTGWLKVGTTWYFLDAGGKMKTGWVYTGGKWYYFYSNGAMAYNTTINGYRLGSNGARIK